MAASSHSSSSHSAHGRSKPGPAHQLGIVAGLGLFPHMVVSGAKRAGCTVTLIGLRGLADASLAEGADAFHWAGPLRVGRWIRLLRRRGVERVILAGAVRKKALYEGLFTLRLLPDWTTLRMIWRMRERSNDAALSAVADEFAKHGITMESCVRYTQEDLAPDGVLTRKSPTPAQLADVELGWRVAKEMGRFDVGQSVAVRDGDVIAVEAIEGTDAMIERAGRLFPRGGWTLVKVAKPNQDMRFDVPTVGPETIAKLARNGATLLAVETRRTVLVEREAMLRAADRAGIVVLGRSEGGG